MLSNPQPPTSPANMDPDGLYQTCWWWGSAHSITQRHAWSYTLWSLGIRRVEVPCTNGLYASCARNEPNARSRNSSHTRRTFQRAFLNVLNLATRRGVARQSCHRHAARKADQSSKIAGADSADTEAHNPDRSTIPPWRSSLANCLLGTSYRALTLPPPNTEEIRHN